MNTRTLIAIVAAGLVTAPAALGGATVTPLPGSLGNPFSEGPVHGWGWNGIPTVGPDTYGDLYNNILTINGGAATPGHFGVFNDAGTQAFADWVSTEAQWGDDLHGLPAGAILTSVRYGYLNMVASVTHTIRIYEMTPPSASHPTDVGPQFGPLLMSVVLTGLPTGAQMVTVTGLSAYLPTAVWIKFGETSQGLPSTFWLSGGAGNGVGTSHPGLLYDTKILDGGGMPLHYFPVLPYIYSYDVGFVASNLQVTLAGVYPAPAAIGLLGLAGLATILRRRR